MVHYEECIIDVVNKHSLLGNVIKHMKNLCYRRVPELLLHTSINEYKQYRIMTIIAICTNILDVNKTGYT